MTLSKTQIIEEFFTKGVFTKSQSAQSIDTLFELMKQSLQNGEDVIILWHEQKCRFHSSLDCAHHGSALGVLQIQGKTGPESHTNPAIVATHPVQQKKSLGIIQPIFYCTKCESWQSVIIQFQLLIAGH